MSPIAKAGVVRSFDAAAARPAQDQALFLFDQKLSSCRKGVKKCAPTDNCHSGMPLGAGLEPMSTAPQINVYTPVS